MEKTPRKAFYKAFDKGCVVARLLGFPIIPPNMIFYDRFRRKTQVFSGFF
jgi:hypothetical protein